MSDDRYAMPGRSDAEPAADAEEAAALDAIAAEAAAVEGTAEPAPGAPVEEPAEPDIPTADLLAQFAAPAFAVLAPNWGITDTETRALADAWAPVVDKYFPDVGHSIGPEVAAALVTLTILGPRLKMPRKPPDAKKGSERGGGAPPTAQTRAAEQPENRDGGTPAGGWLREGYDPEPASDATAG